MRKKYLDLINHIENAIVDPEVKEEFELVKFLEDYKNKIEKGLEYNLACVKISNYISYYMLMKNFDVPSSIVDLQKLISAGGNKYRGFMSIMNWFN